MSSKSGETQAQPGRPRRSWSLTLWLTLFNASAAFCILALIAALLYGGLSSQLREQNHLYLHDEANIIENLARNKGGEETLMRELNANQLGDEYTKHYLRLMDSRGKVVMETPGMGDELPASALALPLRNGRPSPDRTWRTSTGNVILSSLRWINVEGRAEQGVLQVALDVTNVERLLVGYRRNIYLGLFFGFVLCFTVSYAVARRGTRPVREITEMVRGISVSNLEGRIGGSDWPREVMALGDAMNLMMDRLQDSFTRLFNSATNLTHKMRTPLTILRGEAEVALSRERTVEELQQVIISSLEENQRLARLGDNIFFLANADMGKLAISPAVTDLREETEKVVDFYSPTAEEKGITIVCSGDATMTVDPALYRKALAALVSNGFTYNRSGGEVAISLQQAEDGSCQVRVADTGCGIAESETDMIFDRFYRIYGTRHMDPHGTGLGLPIARAIMDLHGGSIKVQSLPNRGTTVTLTFVCRNPEAHA